MTAMGHLASGPSITYVLPSVGLQCVSINVECGVSPWPSCGDWFLWMSTRLCNGQRRAVVCIQRMCGWRWKQSCSNQGHFRAVSVWG